MKPDNNSIVTPGHYTRGGIETIDFIKAKLGTKQYEGYLMGNIIKYLSRANYKGDKLQDVCKAKQYIDYLIDTLSPQEAPVG